MKRILMTVLLLAVVTTGFLAAQNEADDAYVKAMTQSDPCQKVQALKAYVQKYAGKGTQYENFANVYLCLTPCPSQPAAEKIQYGEKALDHGRDRRQHEDPAPHHHRQPPHPERPEPRQGQGRRGQAHRPRQGQ